MKHSLYDSFEEKLDETESFECGYLERSAKRWIEDDNDLEAMYKAFKERDCEITLWCLPKVQSKRAKKRRATEDFEDTLLSPCKRPSKEDSVEQMTGELRAQHGEQYSGPQLCLWARMKLNGQHKSPLKFLCLQGL